MTGFGFGSDASERRGWARKAECQPSAALGRQQSGRFGLATGRNRHSCNLGSLLMFTLCSRRVMLPSMVRKLKRKAQTGIRLVGWSTPNFRAPMCRGLHHSYRERTKEFLAHLRQFWRQRPDGAARGQRRPAAAWRPRAGLARSAVTRLGAVIVEAIVLEYGRDELLRRLAHPFWFQSFGAVMGDGIGIHPGSRPACSAR